MLKAVAQRKAHWLFNRSISHGIKLKRRPQEDLVTSAVFGNLDILDEPAKRKALKLIVGDEVWEKFDPSESDQVNIILWPQAMQADGKRVEPDVILRAGNRIIIVEVKWYAPLSPNQLIKEIRAVDSYYPDKSVDAILLLGEATLPSEFNPVGTLPFARTWRDVARDTARAGTKPTDPFGKWADMLTNFLRQTEFGRIYCGFDNLNFFCVEPAAYHFRGADEPPWLNQQILTVHNDHYEWKGKTTC